MDPSPPRTLSSWPFGRFPGLVGCLAGALGLVAAVRYALSGLTLAHYDAKAHLVVARRIFDSLTPGWEQIGAVWLPLPHLLNALPVQIDFFYRTGTFAVALSVVAHACTAASIAGVVVALTASRAAAALAATLYATNANVLYLQSTPMTEPLLFSLTTLQVLLLTRWVLAGRLAVPAAAGWVTVLACLTRYEAWPITGVAIAASAFAWWRRGQAAVDVWRVHARLAAYPVATAVAFMIFSRITVGEWFVSGGFFVPDDTLRGQPLAVLEKIREGAELVGGGWLLGASALAILVVGAMGLASPGRSSMLVPLSLCASVALPFSAYLAGHPFRMRYEIPLVVACAVSVGLGVGLLRRMAPWVAVGLAGVVILDRPPFDPRAPIVLEAQLDRNTAGRAQVTACLKERYQGGAVMMSMGSLGHYMQELSWSGFAIRDFLHEGNGTLWDSAFTRGPAPLVRWVIVEQSAEGGDAIIRRHRQYPRLLEDFEPTCSGGNVTLFGRKPLRGVAQNRMPNVAR